jgi:hypothetical protein
MGAKTKMAKKDGRTKDKNHVMGKLLKQVQQKGGGVIHPNAQLKVINNLSLLIKIKFKKFFLLILLKNSA